MRYRSKKNLIIACCIIMAVLITVLVLFLTTDIFRTKRSAFLRYYRNIDTILTTVNLDAFEKYNRLKDTSNYKRIGDAKVLSSQNIADSKIMDKLKLEVNSTVNGSDKKTETKFKVLYGDQILNDTTYLRDKDMYAFKCDDITQGYVAIKNENIKSLIRAIGVADNRFTPNEIMPFNVKDIVETSKIEKKHLEAISKELTKDVPNTAFVKESGVKEKILDNDYMTTKYSLKLSGKEAVKYEINILEKVSKDSILINYITSKCKLLNFSEEYTNINSLNKIIKTEIEKLKHNPDNGKDLVISVYEYKMKTIKATMKYGDMNVEILHVFTPEDETAKVKLNKTGLQVKRNIKNKKKIDLTYEYLNDANVESKIEIDYTQHGDAKDNTIENEANIKVEEGIKKINYLYKDTVKFANDEFKIADLSKENKVVLNDYQIQDITGFINALKQRINFVFVKKASEIGINVDPIFKNVVAQ